MALGSLGSSIGLRVQGLMRLCRNEQYYDAYLCTGADFPPKPNIRVTFAIPQLALARSQAQSTGHESGFRV